MKLFHLEYQSARPVRDLLSGCVLTVGNFDGFHRGHQQLIKSLILEGKRENVPTLVFTFHPHPRQVLRPDLPHEKLFDVQDQVEVLTHLGVDYLVYQKFDPQFSHLDPQQFLEKCVFDVFHPKSMVVGYDFSFGVDRSGNIPFLLSQAQEKNIGLMVVEGLKQNDKVISTSGIKNLLSEAKIAEAWEDLGRPYYLRGEVVVGHQRAKKWGLPTANLVPTVKFRPKLGVYITRTTWGNRTWPSVTQVGLNLTFESREHSSVKVETHILGFEGNLYGEVIKVEFLKFLREEKKFLQVEDLIFQIKEDIKVASLYFEKNAT